MRVKKGLRGRIWLWKRLLHDRIALARRPPPPAPPSFKATDKFKASATRKVLLDYASYPHIVERILEHVPLKDQVRLRTTCRAFDKTIDIKRVVITHASREDYCLIEIRTGGGAILWQGHCGVELAQASKDRLRAYGGLSFIPRVQIYGACPHKPHSQTSCPLERALWMINTIPLSSESAHRLLPSRFSDLAWPWPEYERVGKFSPWGRLHVYPDSEGRVHSFGPATIIYLHDNWKASASLLPAMCAQNTFNHDLHFVFPISGQEPSPFLFNSFCRQGGCIYDFGAWRPPKNESLPEDCERRWQSLLENITKWCAMCYSTPSPIYFVGLERVEPSWLDPSYRTYEGTVPNASPFHPFAQHVRREVIKHIKRQLSPVMPDQALTYDHYVRIVPAYWTVDDLFGQTLHAKGNWRAKSIINLQHHPELRLPSKTCGCRLCQQELRSLRSFESKFPELVDSVVEG